VCTILARWSNHSDRQLLHKFTLGECVARCTNPSCWYIANKSKRNSGAVAKTSVKKGETVARENKEAIMVMKWCDKRDVSILSTQHSNTLIQVDTAARKDNKEKVMKPEAVMYYN